MNSQQINTGATLPLERLIALVLRREIARESNWIVQKAELVVDKIAIKGPTRAQINSLLAIANTTDKATDVVRFLERQGGRREVWQHYAEELIREVKGTLKKLAEEVAPKMQIQLNDLYRQNPPPDVASLTEWRGRLPEVYLALVREFIQAFSIYYLYKFPNA